MLSKENRKRLEDVLVNYVVNAYKNDDDNGAHSAKGVDIALRFLADLNKRTDMELTVAEEREERGTEIDDALNAVYTGLMGLKRALED